MNGKRWSAFASVGLLLASALLLSNTKVSADGIVALANGSGQIEIGTPPALRTFTFTAHTDSLGVTSGQTQGNNRSDGISWHGNITCLNVSGNVATMSGVLTDVSPASAPFYEPGNYILFQVVDNGHGGSGAPDDISLTYFYSTGSPNPGCTGQGLFATIPILHGNVTVH